MILGGPLGKTKYYVIRVECQVRGNLHILSFLQIINALIFFENTTESFTEWLDQMISAERPDEDSANYV